jgi:hypothetical protein
MPSKQGVGLHEEPMEPPSGDQSAEAGKERPVRRLQSRAVHLATEDRHVPEHDDLDGQIGLVGPLPAQDLNRPKEGEIEEGEGRRPFSRLHPLRRKSQLNVPDEVLGTHRLCPSLGSSAMHADCRLHGLPCGPRPSHRGPLKVQRESGVLLH